MGLLSTKIVKRCINIYSILSLMPFLALSIIIWKIFLTVSYQRNFRNLSKILLPIFWTTVRFKVSTLLKLAMWPV